MIASERKSVLLIYFLLVAATLIAYESVRDAGFVDFDDPGYVTQNENIKDGLTGDSVRWAFTSMHKSNWHPLAWLSHALDIQLYGLEPRGHHITGLVFHVANVLLLFYLLKRMTGAVFKSAFVAAIFAIHPLHVESVAWVSERKDVLSMLFFFLTCIAYVRYTERPKRTRFILVVVLFVLGLLAKPMIVTLPFVLLLFDYWPLDRLNKKAFLEKTPLFVLSAASCVVTYIAQSAGGAVSSVDRLPLYVRMFNAFLSYVMYIVKMFFPTNLAVLYPYPSDKSLFWQGGVSLIILIGFSVIVFRLAKTNRYILFGWLLYLGTLVPVIGFVQVGVQSMADRYTYLPSVGILIMVAWSVPKLFSGWQYKKRAITIVSSAVIIVLVVCTRNQAALWENNLTLFEQAAMVTEDNPKMMNNYACALEIDKRYSEALEQIEKVLAAHPTYAVGHSTRARIRYAMGDLAGAISDWIRAAELDPGKYKELNNVAWMKAAHCNPVFREPDEALRLALKVNDRSDFKDVNQLDTLSVAYAAVGDFDNAIKTAQKALAISYGKDSALVSQIRDRIELFKKSKPYIDSTLTHGLD